MKTFLKTYNIVDIIFSSFIILYITLPFIVEFLFGKSVALVTVYLYAMALFALLGIKILLDIFVPDEHRKFILFSMLSKKDKSI